jgi:hypothetical protein
MADKGYTILPIYGPNYRLYPIQDFRQEQIVRKAVTKAVTKSVGRV